MNRAGSLHGDILEILLLDRGSGGRIRWRSDSYEGLGISADDEMSPDIVAGRGRELRDARLRDRRRRSRQQGEVSTLSWLCGKMCDWACGTLGIRDWRKFAEAGIIEIACGEAPFLTCPDGGGHSGMLDRKLDAVGRNAGTEDKWLGWASRALRSTYGFELQGDNLFLARINLLSAFERHFKRALGHDLSLDILLSAADIVSWNLWQMDGLARKASGSMRSCILRDWRFGGTLEFGKARFDLAIGNPPYQKARSGRSGTARPVYHLFMEEAFAIADAAILVTPARFLFNCGLTPKKWNKKMLDDGHFRILLHEEDASRTFPDAEIKGGIVVTCRDSRKSSGPIGSFFAHGKMGTIVAKVSSLNRGGTMRDISFVATKFNAERLFRDHPELGGRERRMSSNALGLGIFRSERVRDDDILIYGIEKGRRIGRYISREYVDPLDGNIARHKVVIPKASGCGRFGEELARPELLPPQSGFTHTFLGIGGFDRREEAEAALKYVKTRFFRALLGVLKVTQDINGDKLELIPLQDFAPGSDIDWLEPLPGIDRALYAKYSLDEGEIAFIEKHVREMG